MAAVRLPEFLIGVVLGRMYLVRPEMRFRYRNAVSILAVVGILATLGAGLKPAPLTTGFLVPLFALFIYALASGPSLIADFLSSPLLVLLGNTSYAIYILQVPIMSATISMFGPYSLTFLAGFLALSGISIVAYLHFETPARKWIRQRWRNRKELQGAAAA